MKGANHAIDVADADPRFRRPEGHGPFGVIQVRAETSRRRHVDLLDVLNFERRAAVGRHDVTFAIGPRLDQKRRFQRRRHPIRVQI